jgi:hypothetical protein
MTPAEKTAKCLAGITREQVGSPFQPPPPASRSTSPKYDDSNFESSCEIYIVVFWGGRVGALSE